MTGAVCAPKSNWLRIPYPKGDACRGAWSSGPKARTARVARGVHLCPRHPKEQLGMVVVKVDGATKPRLEQRRQHHRSSGGASPVCQLRPLVAERRERQARDLTPRDLRPHPQPNMFVPLLPPRWQQEREHDTAPHVLHRGLIGDVLVGVTKLFQYRSQGGERLAFIVVSRRCHHSGAEGRSQQLFLQLDIN